MLWRENSLQQVSSCSRGPCCFLDLHIYTNRYPNVKELSWSISKSSCTPSPIRNTHTKSQKHTQTQETRDTRKIRETYKQLSLQFQQLTQDFFYIPTFLFLDFANKWDGGGGSDAPRKWNCGEWAAGQWSPNKTIFQLCQLFIYCNNVVIMIYQYIDYIEWEAVNEAGPHNTFFQLCHLYICKLCTL